MTIDDARAALRRGVIYHAWSDVAGKGKFAIVANAKWPDDTVIYVFTTSQLDYYADGRFESHIVRIDGGAYSCLPLATIIDCRSVYTVPLERLVANAHFSIRDSLSTSDIARLDKALRSSTTLTRREKRAVLPEFD